MASKRRELDRKGIWLGWEGAGDKLHKEQTCFSRGGLLQHQTAETKICCLKPPKMSSALFFNTRNCVLGSGSCIQPTPYIHTKCRHVDRRTRKCNSQKSRPSWVLSEASGRSNLITWFKTHTVCFASIIFFYYFLRGKKKSTHIKLRFGIFLVFLPTVTWGRGVSFSSLNYV